jgi:hypothetical protein
VVRLTEPRWLNFLSHGGSANWATVARHRCTWSSCIQLIAELCCRHVAHFEYIAASYCGIMLPLDCAERILEGIRETAEVMRVSHDGWSLDMRAIVRDWWSDKLERRG